MNKRGYTPRRSGKRGRRTKILLAVLAILVVAFILIAVPKNTIKLSEVDGITLTDAMGNTSPIHAFQFPLYVDAVNTSQPINRELAGNELKRFTITFTCGKDKIPYALYVDSRLDQKSMYFEIGQDFRKADLHYFNLIMNDPIFNTLYEHNKPPAVSIALDGKAESILPSDYQWHVRKADGSFRPSKTDYLKGHEAYSFKIGENSGLGFEYEAPPDGFHMDIFKDENLVESLDAMENAADILNEDGLYKCVLQLEWTRREDRGYYGTARYEFTLEADYPVRFDISATEIDPGELLVIRAHNIKPEDEMIVETDIDFEPASYQEGNSRIMLLPVSYLHKEDKSYGIRVASGDSSQDFTVYVRPKKFIIQYLTIDPNVAAATRNDKSAAEMQEKVYPLKPISDPVRYWEGEFIQPVEGGRVTATDFGKRRYVNNAPTSYRHNGLDIGQDEGTPVKASNNGRVLLAEYLIETGNTVIIEHGYGLKTWYYHMSQLNVKTGDMVKKGDVIGLVGNTGFSTSPHLHFSFSVNSVWINPMTMMEQGVPLDDGDD